MSNFAWFDFRLSGGEKALDQFRKEFKKEDLEKLLCWSDEYSVTITVRYISPIELQISMGGEDTCYTDHFDAYLQQYLWQPAYDWGLKVTGGIYSEDDWGHWRGSFDAEGIVRYASIEWVRNDLTADEVEKLKQYAEEAFGRSFCEH